MSATIKVLRNTVTLSIPKGVAGPSGLTNMPATAYASDAAAIAAGLASGDFYTLSDNNIYSLPGGVVKKITEA